MKITNKQLRKIINEELQLVLNENDNNLQKLATMLKSKDPETFNQAIELTDAIEPFHRAEIYDIIKKEVDNLKKRVKILKSDIFFAERGSDPYAVTDWKTITKPDPAVLRSITTRAEAQINSLQPKLSKLEQLLSKFKTNDMVYVDDPTME